ncbi:MAG: ribosome-binding factor A [Nitriliruptoraceae bacterium]
MVRKRNPRVDKQVRAAVADLLETELSDPRLTFVTITEADVTPDHEVATVYYSSLDPSVLSRDPQRTGGDRVADPEDVAEALASVAGRLRGQVARRVGLRATPDLRFVPDPVTEQAARVDELLRGLETRGEVPPGTGGIADGEHPDRDPEPPR